jgi:hypothetical protein
MDLTAPLPKKIIEAILAAILGETLTFIDEAVVAVFAELALRQGLEPRDGYSSCWTFGVKNAGGQSIGFDLRPDLSIILLASERNGTMVVEIAALEARLDDLRREWLVTPLNPATRLSETRIGSHPRRRPSGLAERAGERMQLSEPLLSQST